MRRALAEYVVVGPDRPTSRSTAGRCEHPAFLAGDFDTGFIAREFKPGAAAPTALDADLPLIGAAIAAVVARCAPAGNGAAPGAGRPPLPLAASRAAARRCVS